MVALTRIIDEILRVAQNDKINSEFGMRNSELSGGVAALKIRFFALLRMTKLMRNSECGIMVALTRIKD